MSSHGITNCFICKKSFTNRTCIYENTKCDHRICSGCKIKITSISFISCYVKYCSTKIMKDDWTDTTFRSNSSSTTILNNTRFESRWSSPGHEINKKLTTFRSNSSSTPILNNTSFESSCSSAGHGSNKALLHTRARTNYNSLELGLTPTCITNRTARWRLEVNNIRERKLTLTFQPPLNIHDFTRCNIYKKVGFDTWVVILSEEVVISEDSFCVKGLEPNELYTFKVEAILKNGEEITASTSQIKTSNLYVPLSPRNLMATSATEYEISLVWNQPRSGSDPISYIIERQMKDGIGWELIKVINASITSYCVKALEPDTMYCFRIMSANEKGKSLAEYLHFKTKSLDVPKPTDLQVLDKTPNEVMLRWSLPNIDKRAFRFDVKVTDTKTGNCKLRTELSNNEILIKDLKPDCRYEFCVASTIKGRSSSFAKLIKKTKPSEVEPKHKRSAITTNERVTDEKQYTEKEPVAKMQELKPATENKSTISIPKTAVIREEYHRRKPHDEHDGSLNDHTKVAKRGHTSSEYKIRGLPNIGMTCYANSILQVLAQTPDLIQHLDDLVKKFKLNTSTLTGILLDVLKGVNITMTDDYAFPRMYDTVPDDKLRRLVCKVINSDNSFELGRQNDSHSFLITMFSAIKGEIKPKEGDGVLNMFEGTFISNFKYLPCEHDGDSAIQMFNSLLIPIDDYEYKWSIEDGIKCLLGEEIFERNALPCDTCNDANIETSTVKTMEFKHLPEILILQMGKFNQQYRRLVKIHKKVYYPHKLPARMLKPYTQPQENRYYRLYGVTLHYGSLAGGHYTAYVKYNNTTYDDVGQWYNCSDSVVRRISAENVLDEEQASLLFYHLIDTK